MKSFRCLIWFPSHSVKDKRVPPCGHEEKDATHGKEEEKCFFREILILHRNV